MTMRITTMTPPPMYMADLVPKLSRDQTEDAARRAPDVHALGGHRGLTQRDAAHGTYWLPPEHALSVTRAAGPGNVGSFTQFIAMLGQVEGAIVTSFRDGGGVPYARSSGTSGPASGGEGLKAMMVPCLPVT